MFIHSSCSDYSDQIFETNSHCSPEKYVEKFIALFCKKYWWWWNLTSCSAHVHSLLDEAKRTNDTKFLDPHNCRGSCAEPGPGCAACTSPEYRICTRNNTEVCLHPELVCDGHQHCDAGEDERDCIDNGAYEEKGIIETYATVICPNVMYPGILTVATACNNIIECDGGLDENSCNANEMPGLVIIVVSILLVYFLLRTIRRMYLTKKRKGPKYYNKKIRDIDIDKLLKEYEEDHGNYSTIQKINIYFLNLRFKTKKKERKEICIKFFELEKKMHGSDSETFICLKNRTHEIVSKDVISQKFPGLLDRKCKSLVKLLEHLEKYHEYISEAKKILGLLSHYTDLFKDVFIVYVMASAVGGCSGIFIFPQKFSSVVILCLASSIIVPLFLSSLYLAINNPGLIFLRGFKKNSMWLTVFMAVGVMLISFGHPVILLILFQNVKDKLRLEAEKCQNYSKISGLLQLYRTLKREYSAFVFIEVSLETHFQAAGQILLLLLATTKTATTEGLEAFFQTKSFVMNMNVETFLIISILLTIRSCIFKNVKALKYKISNLSFKSKLVVFLWSTSAAIRRILCMVCCFIPSLGLLNTLHHWKAEKIPFNIRINMMSSMKPNDTLTLFNLTAKTLWSDIDRWNYDDPSSPKAPDYTIYTGLSLGSTFTSLLCLTALHLICVTVMKIFTVRNIRDRNHLDTFITILLNMNLPLQLEDWSEGAGSVAEHRARFRSQNWEMVSCYALNTLVTVLQMVPLWLTGGRTVVTIIAFFLK